MMEDLKLDAAAWKRQGECVCLSRDLERDPQQSPVPVFADS